MEIQGQAAQAAAPGRLASMEALAKSCPLESGTNGPASSLQQQLSGGQAPLLYALSILVVF